jgi:hypothetical protein
VWVFLRKSANCRVQADAGRDHSGRRQLPQVTFRDVPGAITEGDTGDEALLQVQDAFESALAMYVAAGEPLPAPSAVGPGEELVPLSALGMAKAAL